MGGKGGEGGANWPERVTKRERIVIAEKDVERNVEEEKNRKQLTC